MVFQYFVQTFYSGYAEIKTCILRKIFLFFCGNERVIHLLKSTPPNSWRTIAPHTMARRNISDPFLLLAQVQEEELQVPTGTMEFVAELKLSATSQPITGLAKLISRTRSGNYKYAITVGSGIHQFFFSKEELTDLRLTNHEFGIQALPDGKTLYWY